MNSRHSMPSVNAGSMADIAFLLLIFFLVTTTISVDKGILRKLPEKCPTGIDCTTPIHEKNILRIFINHKQELMVEEDIIKIEDLKDIAKAFIDNNGDTTCNYCNGLSESTSSDNPKLAVISLQHASEAKYKLFIEVQDELSKAYYELREAYCKAIFNKIPDELSKEELKIVKKAYPFTISEAHTK